MTDIAGIAARYKALEPVLDERARRLMVAAESQAIGRGGISAVSRATGIMRPVIRQGIAELKDPGSSASGRVRRAGGGRKKAVDKDASLRSDLQSLVESTTRGDPESPLRWTCKSVRQLTAELKRMKHQVSHQVVADLLHALGYSLQGNRKTKEGANHPDRNAQFEHLSKKVKWCLGRRLPVMWTPRRKSWWEISAIRAANGGLRATRNGFGCTILWIWNWDGRPLTAFMTWAATVAGSAWAWITTRQSLP
jgi:transposase